jgi:hypothetical protein
MNVIRCLKRRVCLVFALAILVGQTGPTSAQTVLIDFGSDTSYRGLSVDNPDSNGNHWNSVQPGLLIPDLIDIEGDATAIDLGWDSPVGTDSYNGPAGPTDEASLETDVQFTEIDAEALGNLGGALEAAFDFASGFDGISHFPVRFVIEGLNPNATYNLTFFGSHSFSDDSTTVYTVYSDDTYTTSVASTSLDVQEPFFEPNHDRIAAISGVSPQTDNILYIEFVGETGFGGYLNAMQIEASAAPILVGDYNDDGIVDAADYVVWRKYEGTSNTLPNDPEGGTIGQNQYTNWRENFGEGGGGGSGGIGGVPEPTSLLLAVVAAVGSFSLIRRR